MQLQGQIGDDSASAEIAEFGRSKGWPMPEKGRVFACAIDAAGKELGRIEFDSKDPDGPKLAAQFVRKHAPNRPMRKRNGTRLLQRPNKPIEKSGSASASVTAVHVSCWHAGWTITKMPSNRTTCYSRSTTGATCTERKSLNDLPAAKMRRSVPCHLRFRRTNADQQRVPDWQHRLPVWLRRQEALAKNAYGNTRQTDGQADR